MSEEVDIEREKIIEKAIKLRELANRGVGGEKENAIRMLKNHREKHNITDEELEESSHKGTMWYDKIPKEERTTKFAQWFKRSIAFDNRTIKPVVFFHKSRTTEMFSVFDHNKGIKYMDKDNYGFCFVHEEDKGYIEHIGNHPHQTGIGVEFKVYLKMLNPYYIYARLNGESYGQNGEQYRPIQITKTLADSIMWLGFDSIIIQDQTGKNVYIVFKSNQIKSIDNNGEYSESDNIFE